MLERTIGSIKKLRPNLTTGENYIFEMMISRALSALRVLHTRNLN